MTISLVDLEFLRSQQGQRLLVELAVADLSDAAALSLVTRLRKIYTAQEVHAAVTMARLRQKAVTKFGAAAAQMFFTEDALQQASDPLIRTYRANEIVKYTVGTLLDACCGIGADSLAFADKEFSVTGVDIDPVRVAIAAHNAKALDLTDIRFETADIINYSTDADVIFFDPARRDDAGKRIFNVEQYTPPLSTIRQFHSPMMVVKLSPGVDMDQLHDYAGLVEFISVDGDLKEAVLWLGDAILPATKATRIMTQDENAAPSLLHWQRNGIEPEAQFSEPQAWLIEPDPALIRAGLVRDVASALDGCLLDETIAYITTHTLPDSPWVRAWRVVDWMPFHLKRLRAYFRERNVGILTVKKRGSPLTPEQLTAQLKLKGEQSATVVLTRLKGEPIIIVCEDFVAM